MITAERRKFDLGLYSLVDVSYMYMEQKPALTEDILQKIS